MRKLKGRRVPRGGSHLQDRWLLPLCPREEGKDEEGGTGRGGRVLCTCDLFCKGSSPIMGYIPQDGISPCLPNTLLEIPKHYLMGSEAFLESFCATVTALPRTGRCAKNRYVFSHSLDGKSKIEPLHAVSLHQPMGDMQ